MADISEGQMTSVSSQNSTNSEDSASITDPLDDDKKQRNHQDSSSVSTRDPSSISPHKTPKAGTEINMVDNVKEQRISQNLSALSSQDPMAVCPLSIVKSKEEKTEDSNTKEQRNLQDSSSISKAITPETDTKDKTEPLSPCSVTPQSMSITERDSPQVIRSSTPPHDPISVSQQNTSNGEQGNIAETEEITEVSKEQRTSMKRKLEEVILVETVNEINEDGIFDDEEISLRDSFIEDFETPETCKRLKQDQDVDRSKHNGNKCEVTESVGSGISKKIIKRKLPKLALPDGWIALNHSSGGIVYLHRQFRVVTWSRPYFLGEGSIRKHSIPISAIPCLHQFKAQQDPSSQAQWSKYGESNDDDEGKTVLNFLNTIGTQVLSNGDAQQDNDAGNKTQGDNDDQAEVEDLEVISAEDFSTFLSKLWEFQPLSSEQERNATVVSIQKADIPKVPSGIETAPYTITGLETQKSAKDLIINPNGKSPVAILYEYCQRVLKIKPEFITGECDDANNPFISHVKMDNIVYGEGKAVSKRQAKQIAAKLTLDILMPGLFRKNCSYEISEQTLEFFDTIDIEDKNLHELCTRTSIPTGSQILQECLKRNQGVCSTEIIFKIIPDTHQNNSFIMTVGKHTVQGPCKNKKIGKQLGSQGILKKLHPHLTKWGSLLRIYCDRPSNMMKKVRSEEDFESSSNISSDLTNDEDKDLLSKLKAEMTKLATKKTWPENEITESSTKGKPLHNMDI